MHAMSMKVDSVRALRSGDASGATRLLACTAGLYAWALRLCGNRADAEDLVQDAYERALRAGRLLESDVDPGPWLRGILHNRFVDLCRRRACRPRAVPLDDHDGVEPGPEVAPAWLAISDDDVRAALVRLPAELRILCELRLAGLSYAEIGRACGVATNTVGTRLLRGRRWLRQQLVPLLAD